MELFDNVLLGLGTAFEWRNLLYCLFGVLVGTAIGVLPGIGPATAVAMLLPITLQVEPTGSMIFFAGIYYGAMYGGSTTSILLNTPGEAPATTNTRTSAVLTLQKTWVNGAAGDTAALAVSGSGPATSGSAVSTATGTGTPVATNAEITRCSRRMSWALAST